MLGAIPNPKKTLEIDFNVEQITSTIIFIPLKDSTYSFTSKNDVLKTFRFEAMEFLSLGVYIDISISSISETKSKIEIEVSRKIGAFDQSFEVSKANDHIAKIATLMSQCLVLTPSEIKALEEKKKAVVENKGCGKTAAIFLCITIGTAAAILF
jgi:hypothetical protein